MSKRNHVCPRCSLIWQCEGCGVAETKTLCAECWVAVFQGKELTGSAYSQGVHGAIHEEDLASEDWCCCGDPMENHSSPISCGHVAKSEAQYAREQRSAPTFKTGPGTVPYPPNGGEAFGAVGAAPLKKIGDIPPAKPKGVHRG